jgi:hypothetical protein
LASGSIASSKEIKIDSLLSGWKDPSFYHISETAGFRPGRGTNIETDNILLKRDLKLGTSRNKLLVLVRASLKLEGLDGWNIFKGIKWRGDVKERDESHCLSDTVISGNFGKAHCCYGGIVGF